MNVLIDDRPGGEIALYIDGNLQFDSSDEALYHESLVLPALCLAAEAKRVLICGGGDGLAARECLRYPGIEHVDLVDYSEEVLDLGRSRFAELNRAAFDDPRLSVHAMDAWEFVRDAGRYDVIVCDFTFPSTIDDARLFSLEWFRLLSGLLADGGCLVVNGVSPQATPEAFAILVRTLRAARLSTLPYRVCIPSFRSHGYGVWGFVLASKRHLAIGDIANANCPVATRQACVPDLARGGRFGRDVRKGFRLAPISALDSPTILGALQHGRGNETVEPPSLERLLDSIPIRHPYQTRNMLVTLAEEVVGSVRALDLRRLVDELWKRVHRLPQRLREELGKLREFLRNRLFDSRSWENWSATLFAALVVVLTFANSLAPDNAFGKGHGGLGHTSIGRGYHGSFSQSGRFGSTMGETHVMTGSGFSKGYGSGPVDVYGYAYPPRIFVYRSYGGYYGDGGYYGGGAAGSGGSAGGSRRRPQDPGQHMPLFVADEDMLIMDNGDVLVTLSDRYYLLLSDGTVNLMGMGSPDPIMPIYADPGLFTRVRQQIESQRGTVQYEIDARRDWLSWTGWTAALVPSIRTDQTELTNLREISRKLSSASVRVGAPKDDALTLEPPADAVELFVGCYLLADGRVSIYGPDGRPKTMNMATVRSDPKLSSVVGSTLKKLMAENQADTQAAVQDYKQAEADQASTQNDLYQYESIRNANPYDQDYQVDYGTDSIPVYQAISLTSTDLMTIRTDLLRTEGEWRRLQAELARMQAAATALGSTGA